MLFDSLEIFLLNYISLSILQDSLNQKNDKKTSIISLPLLREGK